MSMVSQSGFSFFEAERLRPFKVGPVGNIRHNGMNLKGTLENNNVSDDFVDIRRKDQAVLSLLMPPRRSQLLLHV